MAISGQFSHNQQRNFLWTVSRSGRDGVPINLRPHRGRNQSVARYNPQPLTRLLKMYFWPCRSRRFNSSRLISSRPWSRPLTSRQHPQRFQVQSNCARSYGIVSARIASFGISSSVAGNMSEQNKSPDPMSPTGVGG